MLRLPTDLDEVIQQGGTVAVPSRQRAHAARLAHSASELKSGRRVWQTPDVLPVEAWLIREIERHAAASASGLSRLLSPAEDWLLWRQCAAEATADLELVNRGALAEALRRASALASDFGIDVSLLREVPGTEPALLRQVQQAVDDRCGSLGAATTPSLLATLAYVGDHRPVIFSGFLQLSPRLEAIAAARRARGYACLAGQTSSVPAAGVEWARPQAVVAADEVEELERIAQWCQERMEQNPGARLLVVLPGGPGARERLATLIQQALDAHSWIGGATETAQPDTIAVIEGGSPLARSPAVAHALAALAWLGGGSGDFGAVSEWLRAPYWTTPHAAPRARLDLWLRERGRMRLDLWELVVALAAAPAGLAEPARDLAKRIRIAAAEFGQGTASPRNWSERFQAALEALGWPGDRARSSGEQQTIVRFRELLDEFGQLASSVRSMSRDDAVQWFTELAARTAFRPADDDSVVTISPSFADPVVHYDAIWVAGLHAEAFPQAVQPDPFLPLAAQLSAGIPAASAGGRLAEAQRLLSAWRAATGTLVLSTPARAQDLELLPSPLLAPWLTRGDASASLESRSVPLSVSSWWLPARIRREGLLEPFEDVVGHAWPSDLPLPAGTRSLELQNQCPFRAYAELRLGSTELGAPEPGVGPDLRGQLLHAALQRLWEQVRDSHALASLADAALDELIAQSVTAAADTIWGRSRQDAPAPQSPDGASDSARAPTQGRPALVRECRRAVRLIRTLCRLERRRAPFRVQETEFESTLVIARTSLRVRIDRLDALESGGLAILDYKSGRRTTADWYGERPSHPQLLAYLAALGDDVLALATVNVTAREVRFDGVASTPELLPRVKGVEAPAGAERAEAWELRRREWVGRIERLAREFLAGHAAVDPKPGACDFCHVASVCRISDRGAGAGREAAEPETVDAAFGAGDE